MSWLPLGRILFFYLGAILCLGPADLTASKFLYFAGLIVLALRSLAQLKDIRIQPSYRVSQIRRILKWVFALVIFNGTVSLFKGFSPLEIIRDQIAILIFICGVPIFFWCASRVKSAQLMDLAVIVGNFSAIAFWYIWSQGHGLNKFSNERIALSSEWTAFLGLAICLSTKSVSKIRKIFYFASSLFVCIFMLLSLTRTNILLITWIIGISLIANSNRVYNVSRLVVAISVGIIFLKKFVPELFTNGAFVERILKSWLKYKTGGLSTSGLGADQSVLMRREQALVATNLFENNLFFGCGQLPNGQIFDTIVGSVAKFGLIGTIIFIIFYFRLFDLFIRQNSTKESFYLSIGSALIPASLIYNWPDERSIWLALGFSLTIFISNEVRFEKVKNEPLHLRNET
jgi:hypothetical protein